MSYQLRLLLGGAATPAQAPVAPVAPVAARAVHENRRIALLPLHTHDDTDLTEELRGSRAGTMRLFKLQNRALNAVRAAGGGVLLLGCGVGKTLISLLAPRVLGATNPLLLIPAALREKTVAESSNYAQHFEFPAPHLLSYEMLSRASGIKKLSEINPDVIICDEAHALKDLSSTRTSRLGMYLMENHSCKLVVMSGTLFNKTIADFAHLSDWALEGGSPVPRNPRDVETWDAVLRGEADEHQLRLFSPLQQPGRTAAESIYARLNATSGVVLTTDEVVPCSLRIVKHNLVIPPDLRAAINQVLSAESPMTEILSRAGFEVEEATLDGLSASQHLWSNPDAVVLHALGQLICGLLYYWEWAGGVADTEWLDARRSWRKAVRTILEYGVPSFDSPALIFDNFGELPETIRRSFGEQHRRWSEQRVKPEPPRAAYWLSDYLLLAIEAWYAEQTSPPLLWVDSVELGERLSKHLNIPYYGGGVSFDTSVAHPCVLSIASHGTGKNLQKWSNNFVLSPIASPQIWEQLIARTHRTGQSADTVTVHVLTHSLFGSAFKNALRLATIVGETTGQVQRVVFADKLRG